MAFMVMLGAGFFLALVNGANDNFKGVATLFGSGASNYRRTLAWGTLCTFCGSLAAIALAGQLLQSFSGKGLVDDAVVRDERFAAAVAGGAALTIAVATRLGLPVSTTHALLGALLGAGWMAGSPLNVSRLGSAFLLPLLASPVLSLGLTTCIHSLSLGISRLCAGRSSACVCVVEPASELAPSGDMTVALRTEPGLRVQTGTVAACEAAGATHVLQMDARSGLDGLHYLTAGLVSFARGLNDTPKMAALLLVSSWLTGWSALLWVGVLIGFGGILAGRRVAETMSHKITQMNHQEGFTANLSTGVVVLLASVLGLPVSTTHVTCGALFGLGLVNGRGDLRMAGSIAGAWLLTLPCGAALGSTMFAVMRG